MQCVNCDLTRVVQCREKLLSPIECRLTLIAALSLGVSGCIEDLHIRAEPHRYKQLHSVFQKRLHIITIVLVLFCQHTQTWLLPRTAVSSVGVAVPQAITWTTAVLMQPPVSHQASITLGAPNAGLTSTIPIAWVTKMAIGLEDRADGMAGAGCKAKRWKSTKHHLLCSHMF